MTMESILIGLSHSDLRLWAHLFAHWSQIRRGVRKQNGGGPRLSTRAGVCACVAQSEECASSTAMVWTMVRCRHRTIIARVIVSMMPCLCFTPYHAMPPHATPRHATPCCARGRLAVLCCAVPCRAMPYQPPVIGQHLSCWGLANKAFTVPDVAQKHTRHLATSTTLSNDLVILFAMAGKCHVGSLTLGQLGGLRDEAESFGRVSEPRTVNTQTTNRSQRV